MKYILIVGDGMADEPISEIGDKTPLEYSNIENMNFLAKNGIVGRCKTVPDGFKPGSDVANLSLLGFNPIKYYTGRGPLEAAANDINLRNNECAFRCNLVTIKNNIMQDFSAGHITTEESSDIINILNDKLSNSSVHFYTGVDYRNICIIKGEFHNLQCTPPHDITGKDISDYLPRGEGEEIVKNIMNNSIDILQHNEINNKRIKNKELPATQVWLWGQGYKPKLPDFYEKYGIKGSVITAVDLIRGIAKLAGLVVVNVKGATGFVNTNYEGKADAAMKSLEDNDFVFIHVEAPDEAGHSGDLKMKVKAIENIDKRLLGRLLEKIKGDYRILVMPDHPTPIRIKTHTSKPVPFILFGEGIKSGNIIRYSEKEAKKSKIFIEEGYKIINLLFQRKININLK